MHLVSSCHGFLRNKTFFWGEGHSILSKTLSKVRNSWEKQYKLNIFMINNINFCHFWMGGQLILWDSAMPVTLRQLPSGTFMNGKIDQLSFLSAESIYCILSLGTCGDRATNGPAVTVAVLWVPRLVLQHHGQAPPEAMTRCFSTTDRACSTQRRAIHPKSSNAPRGKCV